MKKLFSFISVVALAAILGVSSASAKSVAKVTEVTNGAVLVDVAKDGIRLSPSGDTLYVAHRGADDVAVKAYNAATLELIADLPGFAFGNNYGGDVAVDDRNYVYGTRAIIAGGSEVVVARWTSITDTPDTLVALLGSTYGVSGSYRAGYGFDVKIDKSGNGFVIVPVPNNAAGAAGASFVYVPVVNDVAGTPQQIALAGSYGLYPRVRIINNTQFWYDGNAAAPVLVTMAVAEDGTVSVTKELAFPTMTEPAINGAGNGVSDFVMGDTRYMVIGTNNHAAQAQYLAKNLEMLASVNIDEAISAEWISGLPITGLGSATPSNGCVTSDVHVKDGLATIYVSAMANGLRKFTFEIVETVNVTLNVNDATMGTVTGGGELGKNTEATIIATPNLGHSFVCWMNGTDTVATTAEYTFKVEKDTAFTAHFQKENDVKLTLAVNNATMGSITVSDSTIKMGENTVAYGTPVTLTAVPAEGATFNGWYKGEELYSADYTINVAMTADLALTAKFVKVLTLAYELNGGVTNDYGWTSKGALMLEIQNDYNAAYSASLAVVKEENGIYSFHIGEEWMTETEAQGQPYGVTNFFQERTWSADQKCGKLFLDIQKEKYAFLVDIIDHFMGTAAVGRGTDSLKNMAASASDAYFRADVSGFMLCSPAGAGYPYTCDWTKAGKPDAYVPVWKHAFANPTEIVTEVVLNAPYKEGLTFGGWYATADFSGEPITKVSPESVIEGGKLYAKWIQYIPTIAEVRAMEDGTKTMAAGYVNHVGGNTIYIEDASGFGMAIYMKNSGIKAGQQVVVSGTFTTSKGWPRLNGDSVVSATAGEALGVTSVSTLTALVNDTVFAYYGKRVAINGLKVAKYNSDGDAYFTDGVDTVQGYYMRLDQTTFPVGQKVVIDGAIAAWYGSNFQFTGDVASVTVAAAAGKDKYEYPARGENGEYTLTNNWVISQREGTYSDNAPGATLTVRGMAAKDGMMYFIRSFDAVTNSTLPLEGQIIPVNSATGEMLDPIAIKGEHLFEVQNEDGTWSKGVTVAFNDIKVDHAGNLLIGAITGNSNTFFIYKVDPKTGEATEVIKQKVQDYIKQPNGTAVTYRFDAFGVYGDVDGNACVMAADAQSLNTYRWIITDGKVGEVEQIRFDLDPQYDESLLLDEKTGQKKQNSFSTAPQIFPQDEVGSLFYVDGKDILPMLVDEDGVLVGDFISVPTGTSVWNAGDTATIDGGLNGLCEFKVGNEYFFLFGATNFNKTPSSAFALYKFADESREFGGLEPLWYFPQNGLGVQERAGEIKNGCFAAVPSVEVKGNVATIYIYSVDLGYGVYTFTCPVVDGVENVDTETIEAHKLIENGQVYIIKNGVKYNVLGVTVK